MTARKPEKSQSLADLLGDEDKVSTEKQNEEAVLIPEPASSEEIEERREENQEAVTGDGSDPVLTDDETYADPYVEPKDIHKSGGSDNSDSTDYVTVPESGVVVSREEYDNRGNGVTDNLPNDWEESAPQGATTLQTPSDNASTRHSVLQTVYADPSPVDDKGLGKNVPEVEFSEAAPGPRESALLAKEDMDATLTRRDSLDNKIDEAKAERVEKNEKNKTENEKKDDKN